MKKAKPQNAFRIRLGLWVSLLITLGCATVAPAQTNLCINPPDGVTGPPASPIDGVVFSEESSDGSIQVQSDIGWTNATRYNLHSTMGGSKTGLLQLLRTSSDVYLSLVIDSPAANTDETIVLEFSTTTNHAEDWRFEIKLFDTSLGSEGANRTPHSIAYWRGGPNPANTSTGWNNSGATALSPQAWMTSGIKFGFFHGSRTLEMKIPIESNILNASGQGAIFFPTGTTAFKMYVNALSTSTLLSVVQSTWPENVGIPNDSGDFLLERNTPDYSLWGNVSFDPRAACTGVQILESQIGVEAPPAPDQHSIQRHRFGSSDTLPANCAMEDNTTSTGAVNIFFARPENTGTTTADDAHNVDVTFRMANWGIPPANASLWTKIGCMKEPPNCGTSGNPLVGLTDSNPTAAADVNHGASTLFETHWAMTNQQSCFQAKGGNIVGTGHQCMVAELRSSDPTARFLNTSTRRNMNFVPASKYEENAEISAVGYGQPPLGRAKHKFMITVDTEVRNYDSTGRSFCKSTKTRRARTNAGVAAAPSELLPPDEFRCIPAHSFPKGMNQAMTWIARGYRMTGDFIVINGTKYETTSFVGGFGYVAGHKGAVSAWKQQLTGNGLIMAGDNVYTLDIPPEGVATVSTTIEAVEPNGGGSTGPFKRWGLSLHAGISIPHGNFNAVFDPGPNFAIDLEYRVKPTFSLEAIYGLHHFNGATIGSVTVGNLNVHQFSFNGKVYGSSSPVRPFFNFGGGAYKFGSGSTRAGLNIGAGVQFDVTPTVAAEAMYDFHNVFTSGSSTRFSAFKAGFRFRF